MNTAAMPSLSIAGFEAGTVDIESFDHAGHVYVAWLYLAEYPLADAIGRFTAALRRLTIQVGVPDKYHETISWFLMLQIAERVTAPAARDWFSFRRNNDDLFSRALDVLRRYYSDELLWSERARTSFALPDRLENRTCG